MAKRAQRGSIRHDMGALEEEGYRRSETEATITLFDDGLFQGLWIEVVGVCILKIMVSSLLAHPNCCS